MNEWIAELMNEWMNEWVEELMNEWMEMHSPQSATHLETDVGRNCNQIKLIDRQFCTRTKDVDDHSGGPRLEFVLRIN